MFNENIADAIEKDTDDPHNLYHLLILLIQKLNENKAWATTCKIENNF